MTKIHCKIYCVLSLNLNVLVFRKIISNVLVTNLGDMFSVIYKTVFLELAFLLHLLGYSLDFFRWLSDYLLL